MRVICIELAKHVPGHEYCPVPVVGSVYTVLKDGWDEDLGVYYCLVEYGNGYGFSKHHFATLSEQTADEMEAETREAVLC